MRTKIQKWGNSLGLRIRRGDLVVKPAKRVTYRIHELFRQVTSKKIHAEVAADAPFGREVW